MKLLVRTGNQDGIKVIYLDTLVLIWLYFGYKEKFSENSIKVFNKHELLISPIVQLELQYLHEIGRFSVESKAIIKQFKKDFGLKICNANFESISNQALDEPWTRDPFDRIIVAQAKLKKANLLTKDRVISKNYSLSIW